MVAMLPKSSSAIGCSNSVRVLPISSLHELELGKRENISQIKGDIYKRDVEAKEIE